MSQPVTISRSDTMRVRAFRILLVAWIVFNVASVIGALFRPDENWFLVGVVVSVVWGVGLGVAHRAIQRREGRAGTLLKSRVVQFTLRDLFLSMTLIAVGIGGMVYCMRREFANPLDAVSFVIAFGSAGLIGAGVLTPFKQKGIGSKPVPKTSIVKRLSKTHLSTFFYGHFFLVAVCIAFAAVFKRDLPAIRAAMDLMVMISVVAILVAPLMMAVCLFESAEWSDYYLAAVAESALMVLNMSLCQALMGW